MCQRYVAPRPTRSGRPAKWSHRLSHPPCQPMRGGRRDRLAPDWLCSCYHGSSDPHLNTVFPGQSAKDPHSAPQRRCVPALPCCPCRRTRRQAFRPELPSKAEWTQESEGSAFSLPILLFPGEHARLQCHIIPPDFKGQPVNGCVHLLSLLKQAGVDILQ